MLRVRGRYPSFRILEIIGNLLRGNILRVGRRIQHACGPHARIRIHLARSCVSRGQLVRTLGRLGQTPGRRTILLGCIRVTNIAATLQLRGPGLLTRIDQGSLIRTIHIGLPICRTLIRQNVLRACTCRAKHLTRSKATSAVKLSPLDRTRGHTLGTVGSIFTRGPVYLLRNIASDKGARICVRLVRQVVRTKGRILCLIPRVMLAARLASHLCQIFNSQVNICRSGFPSTRHIRV